VSPKKLWQDDLPAESFQIILPQNYSAINFQSRRYGIILSLKSQLRKADEPQPKSFL